MLRWFLLALGFYLTNGHYDPQEGIQAIGPEHDTRRILKGTEISDTRPYMVYLRPAKVTPNLDPNWLCGGVIISPRYILTAAACIEDVTHFYIVSGTHRWIPPKETNECIKNGATKAIWKCVPKTYRFDGAQFNNIRWMANDIAVVMTAEPINFQKRVKGCDFIPQMIKFNNESDEYESPETSASVAGWGSTEEFTDPADAIDFGDATEAIPVPIVSRSINSVQLMEADVEILSKDSCKSIWLPRYHDIIEDYMICGKNIFYDELHQECEENQMECRELVYTPEDGGTVRRHQSKKLEKLVLQSLKRLKILRRARQKSLRREGKDVGGFCENDHGGPLITGKGKTSMVIGIISAYRTLNSSKRCVGPFLYTSVYKNRNLISCAINRQLGKQCRTVLRESSTVLDEEHINWGEKYKDDRQSQKKKHHSKNKSRKSNHTRSFVRLTAVKLVQNDRENASKDVSEAFLSGLGMLTYNKIRRHVPQRKRSGRVRLGRRGSASVKSVGTLGNHSSTALRRKKSLKSRN
ncbi:uncharacterized protein LOC133529586 [Cydia pomonella]|uniref:uncharacterized protein LOC133529586 n=1 Tax=Cydia pomonella TaxID=82600 RepID=UPI002ADE4F2C|nr:uncharacterized protein LOC133529586 [Cydia pomonella]